MIFHDIFFGHTAIAVFPIRKFIFQCTKFSFHCKFASFYFDKPAALQKAGVGNVTSIYKGQPQFYVVCYRKWIISF
jgi:hypothetical protein